MGTNNIHRVFLQSLLSQPSIPEQRAISLYKRSHEYCYKLKPETTDPVPRHAADEWPTFRSKVNDMLTPLGLEIRDGIEEERGTRWISLVNTIADPISHLATTYTALEISYLKLLIEGIVRSPHYSFSISRLTATRLAKELKADKSSGLSGHAAEVLLERFVGEGGGGWIDESSTSRFSLSQRAILELEDYLKQTFTNDKPDGDSEADGEEEDEPPVLLSCVSCDRLVTKGIICPSCPVDSPSPSSLHKHCLARLLRRPTASCPKCKEGWSNDTDFRMVGEGAARNGQDELAGPRRHHQSQFQTQMETQGDEEEDEGALSSSRKRPRRSSASNSATSASNKALKKPSTAAKGKGKASASKGKKKTIAGGYEMSDEDEAELSGREEEEEDEKAEMEEDELEEDGDEEEEEEEVQPRKKARGKGRVRDDEDESE